MIRNRNPEHLADLESLNTRAREVEWKSWRGIDILVDLSFAKNHNKKKAKLAKDDFHKKLSEITNLHFKEMTFGDYQPSRPDSYHFHLGVGVLDKVGQAELYTFMQTIEIEWLRTQGVDVQKFLKAKLKNRDLHHRLCKVTLMSDRIKNHKKYNQNSRFDAICDDPTGLNYRANHGKENFSTDNRVWCPMKKNQCRKNNCSHRSV